MDLDHVPDQDSIGPREPIKESESPQTQVHDLDTPDPAEGHQEDLVADQDIDNVDINLELSREQTPDTDYDDETSQYSDTPEPRVANLLDTKRAIKRARIETDIPGAQSSGLASNAETQVETNQENVSSAHTQHNTHPLDTRIPNTQTPDLHTPPASQQYDPANPTGARKETVRRRVSARAIDKLWAPLDAEALRAVDTLCHVSLNKVLERYHGMENAQTKVEETQRVLTQHWLGQQHARAFTARLRVSKLPPLLSLQVRTRGVRNDGHEALDIDRVVRRKKACEALLLAELQQLAALEAHHAALAATVDLDAQYLQDFRKTAAALHTQNALDSAASMRALHLEEQSNDTVTNTASKVADLAADPGNQTLKPGIMVGDTAADIGLLSRKPSMFDPDADPDTRTLLQSLDALVAAANLPMNKLHALCDQLDTVYATLAATPHTPSTLSP